MFLFPFPCSFAGDPLMLRTFCFAVAIMTASVVHSQDRPTYDIVVYGGTSAGIAAAVQAARMDKSVVVIEPGTHLGGLTSGGLGWTDSGNKAVVGGISREFYQRIKRHYDAPSAWIYEQPEQFSGYRSQDDAMWTFAPIVAVKVFELFIAE